MGKLGNDEFGYKIYQTLRGEGIDLSHVTFEDGFQTGIYFKEKINHEKLRVHYYRDNSAATTLAPSDLNEEYRSEEHTSELQSRGHLVCRLLLEKKKQKQRTIKCRDS